MKLYSYFRSSASYRLRISLNYKNIAHEKITINLSQNEQNNEHYLKLNPQGLVPTLITNENVALQQSLAILEYLEDIVPSPSLLPSNPLQRARVRMLAQMIACEIQPLNNLKVLNYLQSECKLDENEKLKWYQHWIYQGFNAIESHLQNESGQFCHGDTPTLADVCLMPQVYNARRFHCDLENYPKILEIEHACNQIEAFVVAHPSKQPDAV